MAMNAQTRATLDRGRAAQATLSEVEAAQRSQTSRLKERTERMATQTEETKEARAAWLDALKSGDIDKVKITGATFETVQKGSAILTQDIRQMQLAQLEGYTEINIQLEATKDFNEAEKQIGADAEKLVEDAKGELVQAQAMQNNWFGRRDNAIKVAKDKVTAAESAVKLAKQEMIRMRDERRKDMNVDQMLQFSQTITAELVGVAQGEISTHEGTLTDVQNAIIEILDTIRTETAKLESLDRDLEQHTSALIALREELGSYPTNGSEWNACREKILAKERERDTVEADRNAAFLVAQDAQRFVEIHKMQEQSQIRLLAEKKNYIAILQLGARNRETIIRTFHEQQQGSSDVEAMAIHDQIQTTIDQRMAQETVSMAQAMRNSTTARVQRAPGQAQKLRELRELDTQNQAVFVKDILDAIELYKRNFDTPVGYDDRDARRNAPAS